MKRVHIAMPTISWNLSTEVAAFWLFVLCVCLSFDASAQTNKAMSQATDYLQQNKTDWGLTDFDIADLVISDTYTDQHNGVTHIYLQQRHQGIEIKNAILGLHFNKDGKLLYAGDRFEKNVQQRINTKTSPIQAEKALAAAAQALGLQISVPVTTLNKSANAAQETLLSKAGISQNDIPVKLVYYPTEDGRLQLAWEVQIYTLDANNYYIAAVDASSGNMIAMQDMVIKCTFNHDHTAESCGDGQLAHNHLHASRFFSQENENIRTVFGTQSAMTGNFYRVYEGPIETPNHGNRSLVNTAGDPVASPYGWHHDGTVPYMITRGNNVHAYEDHSGANAGTSPAGGLPGQTLFFDFPLNLSQQPASYTNAAITNLFFWNNYIHDVMYGYGFTEAAGNFQIDNLNRGGVGGDAVMAEAQDGGGTNNANFLTLPDGTPGRMQMYLWSSNAPADIVHIESSSTYPNGNVSFEAIPAAFGPEITTTGVSGDLVLVEANVNSVSKCNPCGCGTGQGAGLPPNNDVQGKIVLIDRGDCSFIEKVQGAQLGGAIGVIVANHTPGAGAIAMGGDETGNAITIPSAMVSYEDGLELKDEIALGAITVDLRRDQPAPPDKDGDLDNGIIAHEYGHGISIRLTGGPGQNCLSGPAVGLGGNEEQAGEGWSDFFALMLTMDPATLATIAEDGRGIGTYILDEPVTGGGIRPARYSTDFAVNDFTFEDIGRADIAAPHGVGFVFCTMLWEMTWNLIDQYGYDEDITSGDLTKGNVLALQLVMDGLKMQPCMPTFVDSRDAILAADQALTGGANQCLIWEAFAKRGLGYSAESGTDDKGDETEAFDLPPTCIPNVKIVKSAPFQKDNGGSMTYTLAVTNSGGDTAHDVVVTDALPAGVDFVSASHNGTAIANVVTFPATDITAGQTINFTIEVAINTATASSLAFADNMEDGVNQWTRSVGANMWAYSNAQPRSGDYAWFAEDPDNASDQTLQLANSIVASSDTELRFWHKYNTEAGYDGGVVEVTNDGGITWYDLGPLMSQNGYNSFIPLASNPLINGFAFAGNSGGWIETAVDLGLYNGQTINVRFRFSSDVATPGDGWYIDDVVIGSSITAIDNTASFVSAEGETGNSTVTTLVTANGSQSLPVPPSNSTPQIIQTASLTGDLQISTFPNPAKDVINLQLKGEPVGNIQLTMLNTNGQQVLVQHLAPQEANPIIAINTSDLSTGMYFLQYQDGMNMQTVKTFISRD